MRSSVSPGEAVGLFNLVASQPQIPFTYPDDGCWARAHEMCRILLLHQVSPGKVWIYGNLHVPTKNSSACEVNWVWHVAPILDIAGPTGAIEKMVIDPAMFAAPVNEGTWKAAMHDAGAFMVETDASVFYRDSDGVKSVDPDYSETQEALRRYENDLLLRIGEDGRPPYNCPDIP